MRFSPLEKIRTLKERVSLDITKLIREKAIKRAKARIALSRKKVSDLSQDEIEIITAEEEQKIKDTIKTSTFAAVLILLGIN